MKRAFKRVAIVLLIGFGALMVAAVITATLFGEQIGRKIISSLNDQLATELTVESFDMTVLSSFPNVSANLRGILLMDAQDGVLLEAEQVAFQFGLLSFLKSEYEVNSVVISNGALNIKIDRKGNANFDVIKKDPDADPEAGNDVAVSLESARLENIETVYSDQSNGQEILALIEEATFSGKFASQQFTLNSNAELQSSFMEFNGLRYFVGKKVGYEAGIFIDLDENLYRFDDVVLDVESNQFNIGGTVAGNEKGAVFDLSISSDDSDLEGVLQLLPDEYLKPLSDFSSSGELDFNATIKGQSSQRENPEILVELQLEEGRLKSPRLTNDLKDVSFSATFTNGAKKSNRSSLFKVNRFKGYFNRELIESALQVENFDDPRIDFSLDGTIPVAGVYKFLAEAMKDSRIENGFGELEIRRFQLKGRYKDMISTSRISRVSAGGRIDFDDAGVMIGKEKITLDRGALVLEGNKLSLEDLKVEAPGSSLQFKGSAFNVIPVLFADEKNSRRAELEFGAELYAEELDIDRLMQLSPYAQEKEAATTKTQVDSLQTRQIEVRERVTSFLKGTFNARIDRFNYEKIEGEAFTGLLEFDNNELLIRGSTRAMDGVLQLDGRMFFEQLPRLEAKLICEDIDVNEFFRQSKNFGQEVFTNRHVRGRLNSKMVIDAYWDAQGNFLDEKLHVLAGIGINDGSIEDFKLLESFSSFVKIKDLQKIQFVNMKNFLEVRNRTIYIPVMFLQSNAVNLTVSGEHNFVNQFKYNIKVNAGQVLVERFKSYDSSLQPKPARRNGFFNLYYMIYGTMDDYDFRKDKRQVKSDFERSEQRKNNIRLALENAFGGRIELVDEPVEWRDEGAPATAGEAAEEPEFLDFELEGGNGGGN